MAEIFKYEDIKAKKTEGGVPDMYDGPDSVKVFGSGVTSEAVAEESVEDIKRRKVFLNRKLGSAAFRSIGYMDVNAA